jgi:glycosyltransferase involved in cell wall biosynthesis
LDSKTRISTQGQSLRDEDIIINTYPSDFISKFSILMPVHNEEDSIESVVLDVHTKLSNPVGVPFEIILAEDGSNDNTKQVIIELSKKIPLKAILSYRRKGYAGGIKEGLKFVSSPYVLVSDSDGQQRPEDFWKLKTKLDKLEDPEHVIVSGNRISRADSLHRRIISKTFQKINGSIFELPPMKDVTSPFKLMHTKLAKTLASNCKFMNESFWTEFIVRACHMKISVIEVPVQHYNRVEGETVVYKKSKMPKIVINQLIAVLQLKKDLTGDGLITSILNTKFIKR